MIAVEVEIYNSVQEEYQVFEAIIDTGATFCVISADVAKRIGLTEEKKKIHLWQVRDPLVLAKGKIKVRYKRDVYEVEAVIVDIPSEYQREMIKGEECTRPEYRNPLSERILLGMNFISKLSEEEQQQIMETK